ncbi:MAG: hypothetical protein M3Y54_07060 [Bacteroidota bacterium]|nr:hypothetical protein [Bacteroidota bacterium]
METSALRPVAPATTSWLPSALLTGLLAGTLDIAAACTQYALMTHKPPVQVLHYVASGAFGPAAMAGGARMAGAGLLFHYGIATGFALAFYWLAARWPALLRRPVLAGLGYGVLVWVVMNLVVVPLTRIPARPLHLLPSAIGLGILMLCIGLPIALRAVRFFRPQPHTAGR